MDNFRKLLDGLVSPKTRTERLVFQQGNIIGSSEAYNKKQKQQGREPIFVLNEAGVCAGLARCFAHSIMVKPTQQENIDVFTEFLIRLQTVEGLQSFLEGYEQAQRDYLSIQNDTTPMNAEKEAIINNFQKLQTQLAYYDTCVMAYDFENSTNDGGLLEDKIQQHQPEYLKIEGLTPFRGNISFDIKLKDLEKFFTPQDSTTEESEVFSPFAPGGTYLIGLPRHAIAVHYELDGSMILYDPNAYNYLTSYEQFREFKNLCGRYIVSDNLKKSGNYLKGFYKRLKNYIRGHSPDTNLEIGVIPVQLSDKSIQKGELLEKEGRIKKRMTEAGYNAMLKKINNTELDFLTVYSTILDFFSFQGEDIFIKIFPPLFEKISGDKELMKALELNIINIIQNSKEEAAIKIIPVLLEKISGDKGLMESLIFNIVKNLKEEAAIKIIPVLLEKISGDKELMKNLIFNIVNKLKEEAVTKILPVLFEKISGDQNLMMFLKAAILVYAKKESIVCYFKISGIEKELAELYFLSNFNKENPEVLKAVVITLLPQSFWVKNFPSDCHWAEKSIIEFLINTIDAYKRIGNIEEAQSLLAECARVLDKTRMIEILNAFKTPQDTVALVERNYPDFSSDLQKNSEGKVFIACGAFDNANEAHTEKKQAAPGKK